MGGIGIGLGVGLGGSGAGLSDAGIARTLAAMGLTDAQARSTVGGAASFVAGLRAVGLMPAPATPTPTPTPTPAPMPLPSGVVAMWDAASLAGRGDGAAVSSWTDGIAGIAATQTGDSTASPTFVADSGGGLPAVRLSGAGVLATTGSNAANAAMASGEYGLVVVARRFAGNGPGQVGACIAASGDGTNLVFLADAGQTGRYQRVFDCADPGIRTWGSSCSLARNFAFDAINGSAITSDVSPGAAAGGQIAIGGWRNVGTKICGLADVLAVIVFDRALTAADFKAIHRRYCELAGQPRPGGAAARHVTFLGDSLTAGYETAATGTVFADSYPRQLAQGLALPWGTWDQLGRIGYTWGDIQSSVMPHVGNVSAATGTRHLACIFEFANMRASSAASIQAAARAAIDALHAQDPDREVIFGTSTDDGSPGGLSTQPTRAAYNAWWDDAANRAGIAAYVPLHRDPDIGVAGAAPTGGNATTCFQADGLHLAAPGYARIDASPYGFRTAVQARLAA